MRRIIITLFILLSMVNTVLAHDEPGHVSDLEQWVAGIGIVLILLASVYSLWWKRPETNSESENEYQDFNVHDTE